MKITKKVDLGKEADRLGLQYASVTAQVKEVARLQDKLKTEIKDFATKSGEVDGKQTVVVGSEWRVGFTTTSGEINSLDTKLLLSFHPELAKKITKVVIDEEALEKAVEKGLISRATIARCTNTVEGRTTKTIYVKRIKDDDTDNGSQP